MENENKDVAEETKKENKEEIKEEIKEATKEETKEETTKEETKEETNDKTKKSKKGLWIGLGILVVLLIAYGVGAFYYHSHFLYQTSVNDTDCSNLTAAEVAAIMDSQSQQYSLQIFGRDENGVQEEIGTVTAPEIGMNWVDTQGAAQKLLNIQNEFLWIEMLWSAQNYDMVQGVAYDADKLQEQLAQMPALQKKNMIEPEDAYISEYSEKTKSYEIVPEIMVPLVGDKKELKFVKDVIVETAEKVKAEKNSNLVYHIGTMIEIPRAALLANEIAEEAEFFSFGTNDLTQMTFGFSRDDAGKFLVDYYKSKIYESDPFAKLDQNGVGQLIEMAVTKGRSQRPNLKIGICGEHGGDPSSVAFCHKVGMDYVSCSPFRVPIARLAAAQAAIKNPRK